VVKHEPESPQAVAWWSCERVHEAGGEGLALWVRYANFGFGWMLTESPIKAPVGRWRLAAWVEWEQAARILGHVTHPYESGFSALARLVSTVSEALDAERRAA
jgi:hypothetical protein